jgi:hypothetical protein
VGRETTDQLLLKEQIVLKSPAITRNKAICKSRRSGPECKTVIPLADELKFVRKQINHGIILVVNFQQFVFTVFAKPQHGII